MGEPPCRLALFFCFFSDEAFTQAGQGEVGGPVVSLRIPPFSSPPSFCRVVIHPVNIQS